jgi:hypothetical protein
MKGDLPGGVSCLYILMIWLILMFWLNEMTEATRPKVP